MLRGLIKDHLLSKILITRLDAPIVPERAELVQYESLIAELAMLLPHIFVSQVSGGLDYGAHHEM